MGVHMRSPPSENYLRYFSKLDCKPRKIMININLLSVQICNSPQDLEQHKQNIQIDSRPPNSFQKTSWSIGIVSKIVNICKNLKDWLFLK